MPRHHLVRSDCATAAFALAIVASVVLGIATPARAAAFTAGPSVRVIPNDRVDVQWSADAGWLAYVEVFDTADATGALIVKLDSVDPGGSPVISTDHLVKIVVAHHLQPDAPFFLRITMTDPTGGSPFPLVTQTPLPPFFTGVQAIDNVSVQPGIDSALVSWEANVIGFGQVAYGLTTPGDLGTLTDSLNITDHTIELTGLLPETTYVFRVSNLHAIDGDALATQPPLRGAGLSFTTLAVPEPSSAVAVAMLAVTLARRRRRTARAAA